MNKQRADFKERLERHIRNLEETSNNEGSHDLACRCADSLGIIRELQSDIAALSQQNPGEQFCDGHCTWLDHHPACNRGNKVESPAVAWLKEWDSVGGAQVGMRRVDLNPDCETWLANMFPKITPLYAAPPEVAAVQARIAELEAAIQVLQEPEAVASIGKGPVASFCSLTDAGRALPPGRYKLYTSPASAQAAQVTDQAKDAQFRNMRTRTLLTLLWRKYDAAGTSMGRSYEAVLLEAAMTLLGDPDSQEIARLDVGSGGELVDETRTYLSSLRAEKLGFGDAAVPTPSPGDKS